MVSSLLTLAALLVTSPFPRPQAAADRMLLPRITFNMDFGWKFHLGNAADRSKDFGYGGPGLFSKGGYPDGPPSTTFSDSSWRTIQLPHDWAIELPFVPDLTGDFVTKGSKPLGREFPDTSIGWYRKVFATPNPIPGKEYRLDFEGVMRDAQVWLNGYFVGEHHDGYSPASFDVTKLMAPTGKNVLVVRVDATSGAGWFYEGAGIYRHVKLVEMNPVHIDLYGVHVAPVVRKGIGIVNFSTTVVNDSDAVKTVTCTWAIAPPVSAGGQPASRLQTEVFGVVPAHQKRTISGSIVVLHPALWSTDHPNLYRALADIQDQTTGVDLDSEVDTFGIRTIKFDKNKGFFLNGKRVEIKGFCDHQDHAGVGAAVGDTLQEDRLAMLKSIGFNALRTSHNPPAPELLDACDKLGILVMDETREFGPTQDNLDDLATMVCRDRNHPSVILWSLGNEEPNEPTPLGAVIAKAMKSVVHEYDTSRPCTIASNHGEAFEGANREMDVRGWNYITQGDIDKYHRDHPNQPIVGSEEASTLSTRGEFKNDPTKGYMSAYDVNNPGWGATAETWWTFYDARPYLAGAFVWTGFDYRGEPTPYGWPCISSHFGVLDTCGFLKTIAYYYRAWWTSKPMVHVAPSWTNPAPVGKKVLVWVDSNCDTVDLQLNGKSVGQAKVVKDGHLEFQVPYSPGELSAIGFKSGVKVAEDDVYTAGPPAKLIVSPYRTSYPADLESDVVFNVQAVDTNGHPCDQDDEKLDFRLLGGAGEIIGVGNGDPSCHEPDTYVSTPYSYTVADWFMDSCQWDGVHTPTIEKSSTKLKPTSVRGEAGQMRDPNTAAVFTSSVNLSQSQAQHLTQIDIGQIDDIGAVFVNGTLVGMTNQWNLPYSFQVAGLLKAGENNLTIFVFNKGGTGGLGHGVSLSGPAVAPAFSRSLFHGKCQVIVRAGSLPGQLVLSASGLGAVAGQGAVNLTQAPLPLTP